MKCKLKPRLMATLLTGAALTFIGYGPALAASAPASSPASDSSLAFASAPTAANSGASSQAGSMTTATLQPSSGIDPGESKDVVYRTEYQRVSTKDYGPLDGHWVHCLHVSASPYVSHPNCNENKTVSTTYTGGASVPAGAVSASMGFNVQQSTTFGKGISFDVPANQSGYLDVGVRFESYLVGFQSRQCQVRNNSCGAWSSTSYVNVQKFLSTTYIFHRDV